jgi:hypothetical protein
MAPAPRRFELEDAVSRPGTYFNPETEVLIVVDDSASIDADIFDEGSEEADWVLVSDAVPVDETVRDEVIERFSTRHGSGPTGAVAAGEDDEEEIDDLDELGDIEHEEGAEDDPYAARGAGFDEFDDADEDDDY